MASIADLYHDVGCCTEPQIPMAVVRTLPFLVLGVWKTRAFTMGVRGWFLLRCLPQMPSSKSVRHLELHCAYAVLLVSIYPLWQGKTWAYWSTIKGIVWIGLIHKSLQETVETVWENGTLSDEESG